MKPYYLAHLPTVTNFLDHGATSAALLLNVFAGTVQYVPIEGTLYHALAGDSATILNKIRYF